MKYNIETWNSFFVYYLDDNGMMRKWTDYDLPGGPSCSSISADKVIEKIFLERDRKDGRFIYCVENAKDFLFHLEDDDYREDFQKNPFIILEIVKLEIYTDNDDDYDNFKSFNVYNFEEYDINKMEETIEKILKNEIDIEKDKWLDIKVFLKHIKDFEY